MIKAPSTPTEIERTIPQPEDQTKRLRQDDPATSAGFRPRGNSSQCGESDIRFSMDSGRSKRTSDPKPHRNHDFAGLRCFDIRERPRGKTATIVSDGDASER